MFIATETVLASIENLRQYHPFFGITFLVCKQNNLPVGRESRILINAEEKQFLQSYYKPDYASIHPFSPFKTTKKGGGWLAEDYASSGSQSTRTRGDFARAFLHERDTDLWGWSSGYIDVLKAKLLRDSKKPISAFWMAIWLLRGTEFPETTIPENLVSRLLDEFHITKEEADKLFSKAIPADAGPVFSDQVYSDTELLKHLKPAPDAKPEEGGTLRLLSLEGVGPTGTLTFTPGDRLSIVTGDNGLGKTFLLECAWWALTGNWAEEQAAPRLNVKKSEPSITFDIAGTRSTSQGMKIKFDWAANRWPAPKRRPTIPGLIIYARVDGSFAVFDPVRTSHLDPTNANILLFKRDDVFYGLEGRIEGLLRDWVSWQRNPDQSLFDVFKQVLRRLSPPDLGPLVPDDPVRIIHQPREIPSIRHHFGIVPITQESAGVKRVITLAYLLVWAWNEHRISSSLARKAPQKHIVLLIDEMEAHLHPKWQRVVLPALLDVTRILSREVQPQLIVTTHSPLILASMEAGFEDETDTLYHLKLTTGNVSFDVAKFIRYGKVDEWLTSELFELPEPRSREGESALIDARKLMSIDHPNREAIMSVTDSLKRALSEDDEFWPRWLNFAFKLGVEL